MPLLRRTRLLLGAGLSVLQVLAAFLVGAYAMLVLPNWPHTGDPAEQARLNALAFSAYTVIAVIVGLLVGRRRLRPVEAWLRAGDLPGEARIRAVLTLPRRQMRLNVVLWLASTAVFVPLNAGYSGRLAIDIAAITLFGALSTSALTYLTAERVLRPVAARALQYGEVPPGVRTPTVHFRIAAAWLLGSGVPVFGVGLALADRAVGDAPRGSLWPLVLLVALGLLSGGLAISFAARAVSDPVRSVTRALAHVQRGETDLRVAVYDASEVGRLQSGFNAMVEGLHERQLLQDLFGRHVGEDVARQAVERGVVLGGETAEASVLFVDVVGSTSMAEHREAHEVVALLNEFFGAVVDVVRAHGGWVNKFEGDGAVCVFGVPARRDDHATCASGGRSRAAGAPRPDRRARRGDRRCHRAGRGGQRGRGFAVRVHRHRQPGQRGRPADGPGEDAPVPGRRRRPVGGAGCRAGGALLACGR